MSDLLDVGREYRRSRSLKQVMVRLFEASACCPLVTFYLRAGEAGAALGAEVCAAEGVLGATLAQGEGPARGHHRD